jgi:hypothetical protein
MGPTVWPCTLDPGTLRLRPQVGLDFKEEGPGAMLWGLWGFLVIRVGIKKFVVIKKKKKKHPIVD